MIQLSIYNVPYKVTKCILLCEVIFMVRSLSSKEARLILQLEWDKQKYVTHKDIMAILKCNYGSARKIAYRLVSKRWLERITAGKFLLVSADRGVEKVAPDMNPYVIVKTLNEPYYFSYRIASLHHGLTTQMPRTIHIALLRQRPTIELKNIEFHFVKLLRYKFFGWEKVKIFEEEVNMTNLEKTVLDAIDREELVGGIEEVVRIIWRASKRLDWKKIKEYLARTRSNALCRRFGFLLNLLDIKVTKDLERFLLKSAERNKIPLASPARWGKAGKLNAKWNLIINVPCQVLRDEIEIR